MIRRLAWIVAVAAALAPVSTAWADPLPGLISGTSPDGLGTFTIHYQRADGSIPTSDAINDLIDAEANRQVQHQTWDASTRRPWTYDATGTLYSRPMTVSELFTGQYNTDEPTMPIKAVSSVVVDSRSGVPITWDNLFSDKTAGLTRLGEQTEASLTGVAPASYMRDWKRSGQFAPVDINFKAWIPTAQGIELHFPEYQFGRGLKAVTVPWSRVADLIAPEFHSIMG